MKEIWLPVRDHEHYEASNLGRVRSLDRVTVGKDLVERKFKGKVLKPNKANDHYQVRLYTDGISVPASLARVVLQTFTGIYDDNLYVMHRDGNYANTELTNLYWANFSEVNLNKHVLGTMPLGENHPKHVLTSSQVKMIRGLAPLLKKGGKKLLADSLGISMTCYKRVVNGKTWSSV